MTDAAPTRGPDARGAAAPDRSAAPGIETPSALYFGLTAFAYFVVIMGGGLPSPLYVIYQKAWGFSPGILTIVFAAYAAGLLLVLVVFRRFSDRVGRRKVLVAGVLVAVVSTAVFLVAPNVEWLIVARILSGMSVGLCANTASAALTEFEPSGDRERAAHWITMITVLGVGVGPLYAGILAQYAPDPLTLSFWVLLGLLFAALGSVLAVHEAPRPPPPATAPSRQLFYIPREIRPVFVLAGLGAFVGFALAGIFSGLVPSFLAVDLKVANHAVSGATILLMFGSAAAVQATLAGRLHHRMMRIGAALVPFGLAGIVGAVWTGLVVPFVFGAIVCGAAYGLTFMGGLGLLNRVAPPDRRGEILSAYYVVVYLGLSVPIVGIGLLADSFGLPAAVSVFAVLISLLSLSILVSRQPPDPTETPTTGTKGTTRS